MSAAPVARLTATAPGKLNAVLADRRPFCHRAPCAKDLLNTGEVLASVRDPRRLVCCRAHLMDTFCHRALCAKGLLNTGEALASVRDPQRLCHVHLMRSALAEGAHLEDGVVMAPKCPAACPGPSSPPGFSLSGKGAQA